MKFKACGPFRLPRIKRKLIDSTAAARREFWAEVEEEYPGLSEACGCYVFGIQSGGGTLPWYVGKAEKQPFRKECLTSHKANHYNMSIVGRTGRPVLFLVPQVTKVGRYRSPTVGQRKAIQELESLLIGMGVARNPNISNIMGTKFYQQLEVEGFLNSRKSRAGSAKKLRDVFAI